MSISVKFGTLEKKVNSTARFTGGGHYNCTLKNGCSELHPVFLLNSTHTTFPYNVCLFNGRYFFVDDVTLVRNNLLEVSCSIDALATCKDEIEASSFFVSYTSGDYGYQKWVADSRMPFSKSTGISVASGTPAFISPSGTYILSVLGKYGCLSYAFSSMAVLTSLVTSLQQTIEQQFGAIIDSFDFDSVEDALKGLTEILAHYGVLGNSYGNAPNCIRSCIWVPFTNLPVGTESDIYLGNFNTGVKGRPLAPQAASEHHSFTIPWGALDDWRRGVCCELYLHLPMYGTVPLDINELITKESLEIICTYTAVDGSLCYTVVAVESGSAVTLMQVSVQCCAQIPVGINQTASVGQVAQTAVSAGQKAIAGAMTGAMKGGYSGAIAATISGAFQATYSVANEAMTTTPHIIGGASGAPAAQSGDISIDLYCVSRQAMTTQAVFAAQMGYPQMQVRAMSGCGGYTECANASLQSKQPAEVVRVANNYLNTGYWHE